MTGQNLVVVGPRGIGVGRGVAYPGWDRYEVVYTGVAGIGFVLDRVKGIGIGVGLGGPVVAAVLWIMEGMGPTWWLWAWWPIRWP